MYRASAFAALTATAGAAVLVRMKGARTVEASAATRDKVTRAWSEALLRLFDITLIVSGQAGQAGIGRGRGRVVVANHRSIIDIGVMLSLFGGAVLSRAELAQWPILGKAAKSAGTIFVERGDKKSGAMAIHAMVDRLDLHDTICLFPEGTTFVDDEVRPFKHGAFVAANEAHVPIVPVGIVYPLDSDAAYGDETFLEHLERLAGARRTRVWVEIGAPLERMENESTSDFGERCRLEVERLVGIGRAKQLAAA